MKSNHRRRGRSGFIFIFFGTRTLISADPSAPPIRAICPRCNREADMLGKIHRQWFTLFFLPVFPISAAHSFTQCSNCQAQFPVAPNQLQTRLTENDQQQTQEAITLYNSLRTSPANSITLNQLMMMYAGMKEFDQAISAAADFPQALHNSEQCMATLGRVYLAKGDLGNAQNWFDAGITRNPQLGEAHYYKAVAYLMRTPPEPDKAVFSARAARKAGYPNADALLKDAESKARGAWSDDKPQG